MMRADPDIIMVGEIRDRETAQIAIEARAHRPPRPLDAAHQRRARRDHPPHRDGHRAVPRRQRAGLRRRPAPGADAVPALQARARSSRAEVLRDHGFPALADLEAYEPVGCARCGGSGYKGRIGLYEVMPVTEEIRTLAIERASADRIAEVAVRQGMRRLRDDGLEKVRAGPDLDRRGRPRDLVGQLARADARSRDSGPIDGS